MAATSSSDNTQSDTVGDFTNAGSFTPFMPLAGITPPFTNADNHNDTPFERDRTDDTAYCVPIQSTNA
jgi:hypothetical protein